MEECVTSCPPQISNKDLVVSELEGIKQQPLNLVCNSYLSIKTKDGQLIHLKLNSSQRKLFKKIFEFLQKKLPVRIWVLKYRQGGVSTLTEAIIYALTSQQENRNALIMADQQDKSEYLFQMSKLYQEQLLKTKPHLVPELKKSNAKSLEFEDIHSQIIIETAENIDAARAFTYQLVHLSECAFFKNLNAVLGALNQSVPDLSGTIILGETTANGMEEFYHEWVRAIEGKTSWIPMFFPWFEMEEYRRPLENGEFYPIEGINFDSDSSAAKFEEEEQELKMKFKLDDEQLNWRRFAIINKCQGSMLTFKREYPATWEEAFSTSGTMFFNSEKLSKQLIKRPIAVGELFFTNLKWEFRDLPHGRINIFERPQEGEQYIIAGDASEALDQDEAAACVLNKRLNTTAATVRGQHPPEELAQLEIALGNFYNQGMVAQENKGYGYQVNKLVFQNYGNVYRKIVNKDGVDVITDELGFNTNSLTRPQMLSQLREEIEHNSTSLYSKELISECRTFVIKYDKLAKVKKIEAQDGVRDGKKLYQDGLLISRAIAGFVRAQYPFTPVLTAGLETKQRRAVEDAKKPYVKF